MERWNKKYPLAALEVALGSREAPLQVHLSNYQARDFEVVDYHMYQLGDTGLSFRGPEHNPLPQGEYFCCVGAAQTLGCFCEHPYPELLSKALDLPALNLGYGGAGPEFFLKQESLLPYLNGGKFVVLQIMSGRSQSNSLYDCDGLEYVTLKKDGRKMGAKQAFVEAFYDTRVTAALGNSVIAKQFAKLSARPEVRALVKEIRQNWVDSYLQLIERLTVPIILLWFSKRAPDYSEKYGSVAGIFGAYPQLVNREMADKLREHCEEYVECTTTRGIPQTLISRFTGQAVVVETARDRSDLESAPWSVNSYYPSPEMQEDAAAAVLAAARSIIG